MDHKEYIRICPGADIAVFMVHGICSTPRHFDFLLSSIPENVSVYNILLDGHGKDVKAFSKTSMKKWKKQVDERLEELCRHHSSVIVVGYSLGTLLTVELAEKYPQIKGMLLLNMPLRIRVRPVMVPRVLRFSLGKTRLSDPVEAAMYQDISIRLTPLLWRYISWLPHFVSLLHLSGQCKKTVSSLNIPCCALFGHKDELVSFRSTACLAGNSHVTCMVFENSGHCYYEPEFKNQASDCLKRLLEN